MPTIDSRELEEDHGVWRYMYTINVFILKIAKAVWFPGFCRWLKVLNEKGVCLITGVPCTTEGGLKVYT